MWPGSVSPSRELTADARVDVSPVYVGVTSPSQAMPLFSAVESNKRVSDIWGWQRLGDYNPLQVETLGPEAESRFLSLQ